MHHLKEIISIHSWIFTCKHRSTHNKVNYHSFFLLYAMHVDFELGAEVLPTLKAKRMKKMKVMMVKIGGGEGDGMHDDSSGDRERRRREVMVLADFQQSFENKKKEDECVFELKGKEEKIKIKIPFLPNKNKSVGLSEVWSPPFDGRVLSTSGSRRELDLDVSFRGEMGLILFCEEW